MVKKSEHITNRQARDTRSQTPAKCHVGDRVVLRTVFRCTRIITLNPSADGVAIRYFIGKASLRPKLSDKLDAIREIILDW
jgi:hypothetical protein